MSRSGATGGRAIRHAGAALLLGATLTRGVAAEPMGSAEARAALGLCCAVEQAPEAEQSPLLERGLDRAELAVAADPDDPVAHLAVFCNLGKRVRRAGVSFRTLGEVRRLRREIDTALMLAPDLPAALAAKGAFLASLPRLLGGNPHEGERLARLAVALAPDDVDARLSLVDVLEARGAHADARAEADAAVALVERSGRDTELPRAQAVVARLQR